MRTFVFAMLGSLAVLGGGTSAAFACQESAPRHSSYAHSQYNGEVSEDATLYTLPNKTSEEVFVVEDADDVPFTYVGDSSVTEDGWARIHLKGDNWYRGWAKTEDLSQYTD